MSPLSRGVEPRLAVDVLIESDGWRMLPEAEHLVRRAVTFAAASVFESRHRNVELCVLLCDDEAIARLNSYWRGQAKPTNVLSFPAPPPKGRARGKGVPLGDIAIAYETLTREAAENRKAASDHLSHLVVHGFLHLMGYDHHMDDEAERMERLERDILAQIGIADPYVACDANI